MALESGLRGSARRTVGEADTAVSHGSGDVEVWATPSVVALCEAAAVEAVKAALDPEETTVGARIELDHLAPTAPGAEVEALAVLEKVDGRTLEFSVQASEGGQVVARGRHRRVRVDRAKFLQGVSAP